MHTRFGVLLCDKNRYASNSLCVFVCVFLFAHRFFSLLPPVHRWAAKWPATLFEDTQTCFICLKLYVRSQKSSRLNSTMEKHSHSLCNLEFIVTMAKKAILIMLLFVSAFQKHYYANICRFGKCLLSCHLICKVFFFCLPKYCCRRSFFLNNILSLYKYREKETHINTHVYKGSYMHQYFYHRTPDD